MAGRGEYDDYVSGPRNPEPVPYTSLSNKYLGYLERSERDTRATAELLRRRRPIVEPDVPADVLIAAREAASAFTVPDAYRPRLVAAAARAILAERARNAAMCDAVASIKRSWPGSDPLYVGGEMAAVECARLIRGLDA